MSLPENQIITGECLEVMASLPDKSIDMILCDLPYGITDNEWDTVIPYDKLWEQYKRLIKDKGAIVLTATTPFDKHLAMSNIKWFKHEWVWVKDNITNFLNARREPLRKHEYVLVFCKTSPKYNPQMIKGLPYTQKQGTTTSNYRLDKRKPKTEPQITVNDGTRYPDTILEVKRDVGSGGKLHPTQKPVALFEYLIRSYSDAGDIVLDNCVGSGTTAVAAKNTGRRYLGIEMNEKYADIARQRLIQEKLPLFD